MCFPPPIFTPQVAVFTVLEAFTPFTFFLFLSLLLLPFTFLLAFLLSFLLPVPLFSPPPLRGLTVATRSTTRARLRATIVGRARGGRAAARAARGA